MNENTETAILAGGCFWLTLQAYRALDARGRKTVYGAAELQTLLLTKQLSE